MDLRWTAMLCASVLAAVCVGTITSFSNKDRSNGKTSIFVVSDNHTKEMNQFNVLSVLAETKDSDSCSSAALVEYLQRRSAL